MTDKHRTNGVDTPHAKNEEAPALHAESQDSLEDLVLQLREANQNLVIATIGAQEMQAQAEAANRRQTEFLSMLAHELRNPLAPISMANELLGKIAAAHPQLPKLHGIIDRQVNHMIRLVDDLLDASRVSSGKITLQKDTLLLSDIIAGAIETSQPFIHKRHQHLEIDLPLDPVVIEGDLIRLAQVFSNLLINATKFTPENESITLSARRLSHGVAVSVKDNGVGIPLDIQPFIFDLFTQGFRSLERAQGGLGIGLSLVRTIAELHGGSASVISQGTGFGSEFIIFLPLSSRALPHAESAPSTQVRGRECKVLLIEDNVDANETLKILLELEGYTVSSIFDGKNGLAMAKENRYDVIVCDIGLPGINGFEVVRQLRLSGPESMPCCIATSGYNQAEDRAHAEQVGFDHYLVKPVPIDVLVEFISAHVSK